MNLLLPQIYEIAFRSMNDKSQEITTVRKIILKIYFALTQYVLPLELINREVFTNWMEVLRLVLEQDIPQEAQVIFDCLFQSLFMLRLTPNALPHYFKVF